MKINVDPPSGWRYGFPRVYDRLEHGPDMLAWLVQEGGMTPVEFDAQGVSELLTSVPASLAGQAGTAVYNTIKAIP